MSVTTIVLADDHQVVRVGLRTLLEAEPDFRVVGEAGDGVEAAQLAERLEPDVLVVDVMMPGLNGLEVTRQVGQRSPDTEVIILSMYDTEAYVVEALSSGAAGYVLKTSSSTDLVEAVRTALAGQRYLSPPLCEHAIEAYVRYMEEANDTALNPYETLTAREREVLHLAAEGYSSPEIAEQLSISPRTVETHRANMMRKLGLHTQVDLARYALQHGIIPLNDE